MELSWHSFARRCSEVKACRLSAALLEEAFNSSFHLPFTESCLNQGLKCRPDKNFFHGLIPLRLHIADNLQTDKIKLAVGNTWGNAKLSRFKDSSSAEEDLLSCAPCGWTIEMGRP